MKVFYPVLSGLLSVIALTGCKQLQQKSMTRDASDSSALSARGQVPKKTACVSFQGNGVYFPTHIGALIAILENNFEPVFASGGSSGAILAALSRALVENTSLSGAGSFRPQDAAVILSASAPVVESVLFLPRFTTPLKLIDSFDVFLSGSSVGVLSAEPGDGMVNAESIVGQSTLIVEFFRTVDFSRALRLSTLKERETEVARLWKSFANTVDVTPETAADALLIDRQTLVQQGLNDLVVIQDRLFKLFKSRSDTFQVNYQTQQDAWNKFISLNAKNFGLDSKQRRQMIFKKAVDAVKSLESFDALYSTFSGQFMLVDPDRVFSASQGFDFATRRRIEIPENTIIHSTARRAKKQVEGWKEQTGLASLHQVYFTHPKQTAEFAARLTDPQNNPLQPADKNFAPVIPSSRIVVSTLPLGPTLTASTGEPTAFLRYPIDLDGPARLRLGWVKFDETLMGYGGWLEKVSIGTVRQFEKCSNRNVDAYFYTSDGSGVSRFGRMAFLGLFVQTPFRGLLAKMLDSPVQIRALLSGATNNNDILTGQLQRDFEGVVASADRVLADNREVRGRMGYVPMVFNHASPSELTGAAGERQDIAIRSNRRAMILGAYEHTRKILAAQKLERSSLPLWNIPGEQIKLLSLTTPEAVLEIINRVSPRLSY